MPLERVRVLLRQLRKTRSSDSNAGSIPTVYRQMAAKTHHSQELFKPLLDLFCAWKSCANFLKEVHVAVSQGSGRSKCPWADILTGLGCFRGAVPTRVSGPSDVRIKTAEKGRKAAHGRAGFNAVLEVCRSSVATTTSLSGCVWNANTHYAIIKRECDCNPPSTTAPGSTWHFQAMQAPRRTPLALAQPQSEKEVE